MPGDLPAKEFRDAMHQVADLVADYLEQVESYPVLPRVEPGEVAAALPAAPPLAPEPISDVLADYKRTIEPNITHWNHPGFMAYIAISGSGPGILGEALAAALNVNAMLWRTSPAVTELEERVCDWLRQMLELPPVFRGTIQDTASIGIFLALAVARERALPGLRTEGLAGRPDLPRLTVYTSDQTHSSIDKAVIALGLGLDQLRRVPAGRDFRLDPEAVARVIEQDLAAGARPIALVATAGSTSTGSLDDLAALAAVARRYGLWYHVDAAYGGGAAILPEVRSRLAGLEEADSIVVNPHKWLFTPVHCSVLYLRDPEELKAAFWVLPEYLRTGDSGVTNLMDYGIQLGKRFRALKLWMVIRAFGVQGLQERIREHLRLAQLFASWVEAEPGFELAAPVPLGIVAFRAVTGRGPEADDAFNERVLAEVNAAGPIFLSHSKLFDRYVLRVVIGNIKTTEHHVVAAWELIRATVQRQRDAMAS